MSELRSIHGGGRMKIILVLSVAVGLLLGLTTLIMVVLFGIANLLPDAIEAIDDAREWLKKLREEKDGVERK